MSKLARFSDALAVRGLTLDDARDLESLNRSQIDHVRWAYEYAKGHDESSSFKQSYYRFARWIDANDRPKPPDFRLRVGETLEDASLDAWYAAALKTGARAMTTAQAINSPALTQTQCDHVQWAIMYTLGYMRRKAWNRELRADPLPSHEIESELASM